MNGLILRDAGIDYDAGIERFVGDKELYETVLMAFLDDTTLEKAQAAFAKGDRQALFACAHECKGSSGNADMTGLYNASSALVALLRGGAATQAELQGGFARFEQAYLSAREGIRKASEE